MTEEMAKFRKLLNDNMVPWHDASKINQFEAPYAPCNTDIYRTHFEWRGYKWSVINGFGSYGGWNSIDQKNKGLLELMSEAVNGGEPVGYLTADEAIKLVLG